MIFIFETSSSYKISTFSTNRYDRKIYISLTNKSYRIYLCTNQSPEIDLSALTFISVIEKFFNNLTD